VSSQTLAARHPAQHHRAWRAAAEAEEMSVTAWAVGALNAAARRKA
jgi:predicted HicB family RNase H-like nuclease